MRVVVDRFIRVRATEIPSQAAPYLFQALRIPNPHKPVAIREKVWGAECMPDEIELYFRDGNEIFFPRGFLHSFSSGMAQWGVPVEWEDNRRFYEFFPLTAGGQALDPIELRSYQEPAVQALVTCEQGQYKAPTGSGKTSVSLEAMRRVDQPTLIIVDKAALAQQWVEQIREKLGYAAGYIGESGIDIRSITVALRQALWAKRDEFETTMVDIKPIRRRFFDFWGCVIADEDHHASAETFQDLLQRFPARYRWGVSATPARDPALFPVIQAIIGPILYETTDEDAGGSLVTPSVRILTSSFDYDYHPTQEIERLDADGQVIISRRTGKPIKDIVRNNYNDMMSALCADAERNLLIADEAVLEAQSGHHVLVISRRKGQLRELHRLLKGHEFPVQMLLGGEKGEKKAEAQRVIEAAGTGTVLLSTVAEEGLDIPRLDRVVLAYPFRNVEVVKQPIGRIMRQATGKTDAVVIDIRDPRVGLLGSQYRERVHRLYNSKGWEVRVVDRAPA